MAAASNKPGAVHYALIIFVMLTVVLGIVSYMNHREYSNQAASMTDMTGKVSKLEREIKNKDDQVQVLKKLVGRNFELVDDANDPKNANTVQLSQACVDCVQSALTGVCHAKQLACIADKS